MLLDAHAHLDRYEEMLAPALAEIHRHQIFTISTAMDLLSYQRTQEIAVQCPLVVPAFGVHPWNASNSVNHLPELAPAIAQSPMLGEIGLDFHWVKDQSLYTAQQKVFEFFLVAAAEQQKIVNLHTKGAEAKILQLLDHYKIQRAIIHWYSGPLDIFYALVDRGYSFTIGVEVLSSAHIQTLAQALPLSQLLTETDNPGGAKWLTGSTGMPALLYNVLDKLAELKGTTRTAIEQIVQDNFQQLIAADPWFAETHERIFGTMEQQSGGKGKTGDERI